MAAHGMLNAMIPPLNRKGNSYHDPSTVKPYSEGSATG